VIGAFADLDQVVARAMRAWRPPPRRSLSQWADEFFVLSTETAAEPGRWRTLPYQVGIMDAITDPETEQVSLMKSSRVGYTLSVSAAIGYYMHQDPSSILVVQPTVDDSKGFSKETVAPMLRDVPVLAQLRVQDVEYKGPKDGSNTLTHKAFPGGILSLTGANSGTGFRRISRRVVILDEVDAYPVSAGSEGDPVRLAMKRSEAFWNRKTIAGSTPLLAGRSRIEALFLAGDQRRYFVPCPACGHMDFLAFREGERGHWMAWTEKMPKTAHFVCRGCGCEIPHHQKRWMVERGEWRGSQPFKGHASFHIWAAYSYAPNATWEHIVAEFLSSKAEGPEALRTFVNTALGETWVEKGEAPDWQRVYLRREKYELATVPIRPVLLTAGVDVQRDRLVWEVVAWGGDKASWSIDAGVIPGDTSREGAEGPWPALDQLLERSWAGLDGVEHRVQLLAIDAGFNTQMVYNWARRYPMNRVIACKGVSTAKTLIGSPSPVDVTTRGKKMARGYKVWPVGVDIAKSELYGWLRLDPPTKESGDPLPPGFCHFPEHGEEYFKQLTAEHLVSTVNRRGFRVYEWQVLPGRENHYLDCRVYARAAAALAGLDRHAAGRRVAAPAKTETASASTDAVPVQPSQEQAQAPRREVPRRSSWLGGGSGGTPGRGGWLSKRR
jgi:phage terminase large subunit GpA-like protein